MAQISFYVDDGVLDSLKQRAAAEGISVSKLTARIIEADRCSSVWPDGWFISGQLALSLRNLVLLRMPST